MADHRVLVLDNGAGEAKFGFGGAAEPSLVAPNCTATPAKDPRKLVASDTVSGIKDHSKLLYSRPHDRGYLTNPPCQTEVWEWAFEKLALDPAAGVSGLLLTEPVLAPEVLCGRLDELVFEKFGFNSCYRTPAAPLAALDYHLESPGAGFASNGCCVVVDSGFSFTHATPIFDNCWLKYAVRRVDVGGKLLTNLLKELVSYRQLNVMDDTHVLERCKRELCYVTTDFDSQVREAEAGRRPRNTVWRDFVLPNYEDVQEGFVAPRPDLEPQDALAGDDAAQGEGGAAAAAAKTGKDQHQRLCVNNERFTVPEVLFNPRDVGLEQGGVHDATSQAIASCAPEMHRPMYANVLLTGGNARLPGFRERLARELQSLAPAGCAVNVAVPSDPVLSAWRGGSRLAASQFRELAVTKAQYEEFGHDICRRSFSLGFGEVVAG